MSPTYIRSNVLKEHCLSHLIISIWSAKTTLWWKKHYLLKSQFVRGDIFGQILSWKEITYKLCIVYLSIYSVWCLSYFVIWASNDLRAADRPILMIASRIVFRQPLKLWRNFAPLLFFQIPPQFKLLFGFCSSSVFFQKVPKFQVIVVFCSSFVVF